MFCFILFWLVLLFVCFVFLNILAQKFFLFFVCLQQYGHTQTSHVEHSSSKSSGYSGTHHGWMMINSLLTLAFGVTLTCFSVFHGSLVARGLTTIEVGARNPFDLGFKQNWISIFGNDWKYMFLPVPTMTGDGYEFSDNNPLYVSLHMFCGLHCQKAMVLT